MIIVVGPFPPPVHGASFITQKVTGGLVAEKIPLLICNTSPGSAVGRLRYHFNRILVYVRWGCVFVGNRREATGSTAVYFCLSGGLGLVYDFLIVLLARLRRY